MRDRKPPTSRCVTPRAWAREAQAWTLSWRRATGPWLMPWLRKERQIQASTPRPLRKHHQQRERARRSQCHRRRRARTLSDWGLRRLRLLRHHRSRVAWEEGRLVRCPPLSQRRRRLHVSDRPRGYNGTLRKGLGHSLAYHAKCHLTTPSRWERRHRSRFALRWPWTLTEGPAQVLAPTPRRFACRRRSPRATNASNDSRRT